MYKKFFLNKDFMKLTAANMINAFGDSVDGGAFTWLTYEISQSAALSAVVAALNILPTALFQPIAGPIAERCRKRRLMIQADVLRGCMVGGVLALFLTGGLKPWMLLLTTFLMNTVEAMRIPCGTALIPQLLEKEEYDSCLSLSRTLSMAADMAGMALGGVLTAVWIAGAFWIDMATFLVSAVLLWCIRHEEFIKERKKADNLYRKLSEYRAEMKGGISYLKKNDLFLLLVAAALLFNMVGGMVGALEAPYAARVFGGAGEVISMMGIAQTLGMTAGMLLYPKMSEKLGGQKIILIAYAGEGIYVILLLAVSGLGAGRYIGLFAASAAMGVCTGLIGNLFNVLFVKAVDKDYMARATGFFNSAVTAASPAISFLVAALVECTGVEGMFVSAAVGASACVILFSRWKTARLLTAGYEEMGRD